MPDDAPSRSIASITGASTTAMAWFGVLIGHRYAEYRLGFEYVTLARELVNRHGYDAYEAENSAAARPAQRLDPAAVVHYRVRKGLLYLGGDPRRHDDGLFAACHRIINFLSRGDHWMAC
ncbi:hypothetical protein ACVXG7_03505 [Enterobacter hormaechei]